MAITLESSLLCQCKPEHIWKHFQDIAQWPASVPRVIGNASWTEGEPWQKGSKFGMRLLKPMPMNARPEIIECNPPTEVHWMSAGTSISMEQWFRFEQQAEGTTKISAKQEFTGPMTFMFGDTVQKQVLAMYDEWLGALKQQAEQTASEEAAASV